MQLTQRFPTKPTFTFEHKDNKKVRVCSNLVKIRFKPIEDNVFIYALKIFPELPNDSTLYSVYLFSKFFNINLILFPNCFKFN